MMPNEAQRRSRYHCSGKRPPYLKQVLAQFAKVARGRGYVSNKGVAQSACAKGNHEYNNPNRACELVNFLKNTGVLIEVPEMGDDRLFYDPARAAIVLECCSLAQEPPPAEPDEVRIRRIQESFDPPESGDDSEAVPDVVAEPAPNEAVAQNTTCLKQDPIRTHVLYLTKSEDDVWTALCTESEETSDGVKVRIPWEPCEDRRRWVAQSLSCDETKYVCMVQRFVMAKILERDGVADGQAVFRFTRHPLAYFVVKIEERSPLAITRQDLELIRAVQAEFQIKPDEYLIPTLETWVYGRIGKDFNAPAWRNRIVGHRPGDKFKGWGVLFRKGAHPGRPRVGEVETYVSVQGFEAYDFQARENAPAPVAPPPPPPEATVVAPTPCACSAAPPASQPTGTTMPSPAPTEAVADGVPHEPYPRVTVVEMPVAAVLADRRPEGQPFQSLTEPAPPPEIPESPVQPAAVQVDQRVVAPPEVPASIEAMSDVDLEAKLAEWHRMHTMAQQVLARRRTEKIQRLSAEIADNQFKLTVVVGEAVELETTAAIKRKQASDLEDAIAKLRQELATLESKS